MPSIAPLAVAFFALLKSTSALETIGFGPAFSLGPTSSWVRASNTTLVLPKTPGLKDNLALWPGMQCSSGDLVQALAVSVADPATECGGEKGQWCVWASTLKDGTQLAGDQVPANAGDYMTITYAYNDDTAQYDQNVYINGELVSTLSTTSGHAEGWGTAVECQDDACDITVAKHQYLDTTVVLNSADKSFGDTLDLNAATSSTLSSEDGITWTVKTINHEAYTYNSDNTDPA
ncbi:hypothetical protein BJX76DRAFT_306776 [Aspergillus varians]